MSDNRNFERDEIPGRTPGSENGEIEHNSMRPDRFPEGEVGNWQRKEKNLKKKRKKDSTNLEQLVNDVKGTDLPAVYPKILLVLPILTRG
jgi:hypothetical protein